MKVTYCASPVLLIREFTMANRILTENLLRNDKLDVRFNYSALECYKKYSDMAYDLIPQFDHEFAISYALCKETIRLYTSSYYYPKEFVKGFNTDIVILSFTSHWFDYPFLAELLNSGFKVVVGGSNFRLWATPEWVENLMREMGVKEKYMKNFIVVEGLVDLTTDIHKIIKDWKHCKITENDLSTVWDCTTDYLMNIKNTICKTVNIDFQKGGLKNFYQITFLTNNKCWWGKCSFCGFGFQPNMCYDEGVEAERIAQNIIDTCKGFGGSKIYFSNDYFQFTDKHKKILEIINQHGINKVNCYSGIKLLQSEKTIENYNQYGFKYLKVGMESGTDFSLKKFNKGYDEAGIDYAISKVKKCLNKDTELVFHIINDAPHRSKEEVKRNYRNILRWKYELQDAGFTVNFTASCLAIIEGINDDRLIDNKFLKKCDIKDCQSGRIKLLNELGNAFGDDIVPTQSYDRFLGFNRYDENGDMLLSDFEILANDDDDTIRKLYGDDNLFCAHLENE